MSNEPTNAAPDQQKPGMDAGMYLGLGCLIMSLVVLGISALIFLSGFQMLQNNADPAMRVTVAKQILGVEELPAGLHPALAMQMPDALQMVVLTDDQEAAQKPDGSFNNVGIAIFRILSNPKTTEEEFRSEFIAGKQEPEERDAMMPSMDDGRSLGDGTLTVPNALVRFNTQIGTLRVFEWDGPGVVTRFIVECNAGGPPVFGLWFMKNPLDGTQPKVADTDALSEMLKPMQFCEAPKN